MKGNYIQWLRQASVDDIQAENYPGPKPTSLLYKILRQSRAARLRATWRSSAEIDAGALAALAGTRSRDHRRFSLRRPPLQPPVSVWEVLARPSDAEPAAELGRLPRLARSRRRSRPSRGLPNCARASTAWPRLPTAELDRLLDRDARRVQPSARCLGDGDRQRAPQAHARRSEITGVHLGGFGWVEEVRPAPQRPRRSQGADLERVRRSMHRARADAEAASAVAAGARSSRCRTTAASSTRRRSRKRPSRRCCATAT